MLNITGYTPEANDNPLGTDEPKPARVVAEEKPSTRFVTYLVVDRIRIVQVACGTSFRVSGTVIVVSCSTIQNDTVA